LKQSSYHYEEVIYSIEKWLIDGDLDSKETKGNQAYTYEIDPSPISEQKQNGQRQIKEVFDTSNFPSEHLQDQAERSTLITSTSTSQSIKKKEKSGKDLVNLMAMYNTLLGLIKVLKYSKLDRAHQKSSPWICLKVSRFLRWISTKTSNAMGHLFVSYF